MADAVTTRLWRDEPPKRAGGYVRALRTQMRTALGTWPWPEVPLSEHAPVPDDFAARWQAALPTLLDGVEAVGELFVGMANGPYLLLLRADDPTRAIDVLSRQPVQEVEIHWSREVAERTVWTVSTVGAPPVELSFTLPEPVADWIFDEGADARRRAMAFKQGPLSTITIYRHVGGRDQLFRLQFSRAQVNAARGRRRR